MFTGKLLEEIEELKAAERSGSTTSVREEIGDILFTVVNVARFQAIDPEDALRLSCDKFIRRFSYMEGRTNLQGASPETMEGLWNEAKNREEERGE